MDIKKRHRAGSELYDKFRSPHFQLIVWLGLSICHSLKWIIVFRCWMLLLQTMFCLELRSLFVCLGFGLVLYPIKWDETRLIVNIGWWVGLEPEL